MSSLSSSCLLITLASSTNNNQTQRTKGSSKRINPALEQHRKQLAILEMERAIGAGTYRDTEPKIVDKKKILFHGILPDFGQMLEGSIEKQVRQTGEWIATSTEQRIRSSRKGMLILFVKWILPIWALSLLVASGAVKLPFSIPFIDDLIM